MTDFYHSPFRFSLFLKFLALGLVCAAIFIPLASAMHATGHGLFGMLGGCRWVGVFLPADGHSQAIVNYPDPLWAATKGSVVLWMGGYFWILVLSGVILLFPTANSLIQNLVLQILGFHLVFFGFLKEVLVEWGRGDARTAAQVMQWSERTADFLLLGTGAALTVFFAVRCVMKLGQSLKGSAGVSLLLAFTLWFLPTLAFVLWQAAGGKAAWMILLAFLVALFLASPLIPAGSRLWETPSFARPLYGLLLAALIMIALAVGPAGWGRGSSPILWGPVDAHANYDPGVRL